MTTWCVSPFYNELDVLEIKLATLSPLIDRFVLAEATVDQRGNPKPLYLKEAQESGRFIGFAPFDKVSYVVVDDMPTRQEEGTAAHWERENHQRDALMRGMGDLKDDDIVLISDLDEIPYPEALEEGLEAPGLRFPMDMHVYRLNWRWTERPVRDGSTAVTRPGAYFDGRTVHQALIEPTGARWRTDSFALATSSGWHLAYMYDEAGIRAKTQAIADNAWRQLIPEHKKADPLFWSSDPRVPTDALLERCIKMGCDVYGRDYRQAEWVDLDELPDCVASYPEKFGHLLIGCP